jgi:predicted RNase H-like nuclease
MGAKPSDSCGAKFQPFPQLSVPLRASSNGSADSKTVRQTVEWAGWRAYARICLAACDGSRLVPKMAGRRSAPPLAVTDFQACGAGLRPAIFGSERFPPQCVRRILTSAEADRSPESTP